MRIYKSETVEEKMEEDFTNINLRKGDSAYIFYCKSQLQKYLSPEQWNVNDKNGCISIYNKIFKEKFAAVDTNLASKLKLQIWMKRPQKEKASLQVEVAGAGPGYKKLKLELSNSMESKFSYDKDIMLAKETVGIVMTLNIKALGIVDESDDTIDKLSLNNEAIQEAVKKFIGYLNMNIINNWIVNDAVPIIKSYKRDAERSLVEDTGITELDQETQKEFSISKIDKLNPIQKEEHVNGLKNRETFGDPSEANKAELDEQDNTLIEELKRVNLKNAKTDFEYKGEPKEKQSAMYSDGNKIYPRDRNTAINALAHAHYLCEIDGKHPTFLRKNSDKNYTEPHHLVPMAYSEWFTISLDVEENIVSLCSNCHNQLHYGEGARILLRRLYDERKENLEQVGIKITFDELLEMY